MLTKLDLKFVKKVVKFAVIKSGISEGYNITKS